MRDQNLKIKNIVKLGTQKNIFKVRDQNFNFLEIQRSKLHLNIKIITLPHLNINFVPFLK